MECRELENRNFSSRVKIGGVDFFDPKPAKSFKSHSYE